MEAILLAGGLGTRLHQVTGDQYPKSLAEVAGRPFIHYIIKYLASQGVERFILAISHHGEMIEQDLATHFPELDICYSRETEPMGTGGAIKQALSYCQGELVLIANADSFMEFSLADFTAFYHQQAASLAILCTQVNDVARFGAADINEHHQLRQFFEKGRQGSGFINSGLYLIDTKHPRLKELEGKFSFEQDVLADQNTVVYAKTISGLFFDIGTPDDFVGAQALVNNHGHLFQS